MENEFYKVMSQRTDEELIKILTVERSKYQPLAIEAAQSEIKKRNIDKVLFEQIKEKAVGAKKQKEKIDTNIVGSGIRFVNFIIDSTIILSLAFIISFVVGLCIQPKDQTILSFISYILIFGTFITYYIVMETKFQKTVGKIVTKTKVAKLNGEKPNNSDIIGRSFYRLIPFDRLSFLFVKNGIHDYLSKTTVVKDRTV